jgi:hypothetical protein
MYLCVPYDSHNKQRLFPLTELADWSLLWRRSVSCEVRTQFLNTLMKVRLQRVNERHERRDTDFTSETETESLLRAVSSSDLGQEPQDFGSMVNFELHNLER